MFSRKVISNFNVKNYFQGLLTTSQNVYITICTDVSKQKPKTAIQSSNNVSVSNAVNNYLKEIGLEYFKEQIPKKLLRKTCTPTSKLYLFDHKTAKEIALMISGDLLRNSSFVIECNPGIGLLTLELLQIGVPCIHLYEKLQSFCHSESPVGKLIIEYNNHIDLRILNFHDAWLTLLNDKHNAENHADIYFNDMPYRSWQNDPIAQIIAYCPSRNIYSLIIHNFFNQTQLFEHGRVTFFLVLPEDIWQRATANNLSNQKLLRYYNHYNVLLHLFFKFKYLGSVPRHGFAPWPSANIKQKINKIDIPMQIIKLEPLSNLFDLISHENLKSFWFFLKHVMRSKSIKVIEEMEKWVPGCGPRLIRLEIDICTRFKELSPTKLFELFNDFLAWPEYDETYFVPNRSTYEIKKENEEKIELDEEEQENISVDDVKDDGSMKYKSIV